MTAKKLDAEFAAMIEEMRKEAASKKGGRPTQEKPRQLVASVKDERKTDHKLAESHGTNRCNYIPPLPDRRLELEALILTATIIGREGITHPGDVQAIHASVLRILIADKAQTEAPRNRVLDALGLGDSK